MRRILHAVALAPLVAAAPVLAQEAGSEEGFNRIYRSAYFLGRGDTGVAIADDEDAIFYNPAGLAYGKGIYKRTVLASPTVEFSENTRNVARQLAAENADAVDTVQGSIGKPNHLGASTFTGLVLRRAAVGLVATSNVDLLAYKSPDQGALEVVDASADQTVGATFSLAEGFFSNTLLVGVTAKYLARGRGEISVSAAEAETVKDQLDSPSDFLGSGEGGGADVGFMLRGGGRMPLSLGLTVNDVGDTKITPQEDTSLDLDVKQTINVGAAAEVGTKYSKLRLLADVRDVAGRVTKNDLKKLHLGGELSVLGLVGVTGGLNQGYPTAGLYADVYVLRLDAGMYTEEVGDRVGTRPDPRYYIRLRAGF